MKLSKKVAIVTGGARGIGAAIVRAYVREGARVLVADIEAAAATALASEVGGRALACPLDVRDPASIEAMVETAEAAFGGIDILVNNAGVFDTASRPEVRAEMYRRQFDINVGGLELIQHRIRVNAIAPGVVDTPMWDRVDGLFAKYENRPLGEKKRLVGEAVPAGRMGHPEDIARPAVFLASDDAGYVVAQTLNVDGGNWMS